MADLDGYNEIASKRISYNDLDCEEKWLCDECHLLVVISSSEEGSYCWFTKDIDESLFSHKFKSIQFYKAHFNLFDLYGVYPKD